MNIWQPDRLRSALYARNLVLSAICWRMGPVH